MLIGSFRWGSFLLRWVPVLGPWLEWRRNMRLDTQLVARVRSGRATPEELEQARRRSFHYLFDDPEVIALYPQLTTEVNARAT